MQAEVTLVVASGFSRKVRILDEALDWIGAAATASLFAVFVEPAWVPLLIFATAMAIRISLFVRRERGMQEYAQEIREAVERLEWTWDEREKEHHGGQ